VAFGPRTTLLLLVGLVWLVPAFIDRRFVLAMLAWDGLVLLAWIADVRRLPSPSALIVRRTWLAPPALSVRSTVQIAIENRSTVTVSARVVDAVPTRLRPDPPQLAFTVSPGGEASGTYDITPVRRGEAPIAGVFIRYQSAWRLAERWARADVKQVPLACPDLELARSQSIYLVRSRQIEMEKRSARVRGTGRAFESLRDYRPGDELRDVCWTASARRARLVTRQYEIERSQTVWLVLDAGRLMRARVAGLSKLDHAVNAALALAQVALGTGDRVGVLGYGRRITLRLPASHGSTHLRRIVERLARLDEDDWEGDHLLAAGRLLSDQKRRSLIVWLTDLSETAMTPEVVRAATQLMTRHVVMFVVIGEPDLRRVAERRPGGVHEMYESAAAQDVLYRRERLLGNLREGGALAFETTSSRLAAVLVNSYLDLKQRNRL
ncbi:MAG TPA: DUF58 domain-containing protein, partial [Vicinamibacterales bacterium]|nr:DUF58 domain-containing protein [Vicinamibacterales bacterium]